MKARAIKTDNYKIKNKIYLREKATAGLNELRVLDVFAGNNTIWSGFNTSKYYGIEIIKGKGNNLNADNLKALPSLDLSEFNVIDLDSYGIPAKQIEAIFHNPTLKPGTVFIYTCITSGLSGSNGVIIDKFNLSKIYRKAKTLVMRFNKELFHAFLYELGVECVYEYSVKHNTYNKNYGYFVLKDK